MTSYQELVKAAFETDALPEPEVIRLLIVEDDVFSADLIARMFAKATESRESVNLDTERVRDLQSAIRHLSRGTTDIIFLDLNLTDSRGFETFKRIHQDFPEVPIVVLSSVEDPDLALKLVRAGAQDYLVKSFIHSDVLLRVLRYAVGRRSREWELRASMERFRNMVQEGIDAILMLDVEEKVLFMNPAAEILFGKSAAEMVGQPFGYELSGDDMVEINIQGKPGERCVGELRVVDMEWQGKPAQLVTIRDVTARKDLEEKFLQSQKMEGIGRLAGGIAHDFNNILTSIIGFAQMVEDKLTPSESMDGEVAQIIRSGERAAELTRKLLAVGRKQVVQVRSLDLNDTIRDMHQLLQRTLGADVDLRYSLLKEKAGISADAGQIEQILMNLAVNARDAMPKGGVLTIETSRVEVEKSRGTGEAEIKEGSYICLTFSDTGCGMDGDTLRMAFDPFYTTKPVGKGTGLGLSTIYGIVRQHGGHIELESQPGSGTVCRIYFEEHTGDLDTEEPEHYEVLPGGKETILLVEDEEAVLRLVSRTLTQYGYKVMCARDGCHALEVTKAHEHPVDLILTDVIMPRLNGPDFVKQYTALHGETAVLYASGFAPDQILDRGLVEGEIELLEKPYTLPQLLRRIRQVFDQAGRRQRAISD